MAQFDEIQLRGISLGGKPVGFTKSTGLIHLAGDDITVKQWQELERRINLLFTRAGLQKDPRKDKSKDPNSGTSSFLTHNLKQILERDEGLIKEPPFFLKPFYSGVITKERLWRL